MKKIYLSLSLITILGFASCNFKERSDDNQLQPLPKELQSATQNAMEVIDSDPELSTFASAIRKAKLEGEYSRFPAKFTIFAPTNAAFTAANINVSALPEDVVRNVIRYHVLATEDFRFARQITSGVNETGAQLPNNLIWINVPRLGEIFVNGFKVTTADVPAKNAVIHKIEGVLLPPTQTMYQVIASDPNLSLFRMMANTCPDLTSPNQGFTPGAAALRQTLKSTRFVGMLPSGTSTVFAGQNITIFVPTNAALNAVGITDSTSAAAFINSAAGQIIINHHLHNASGRVFAGGLLSGPFLSFVGGRPINVEIGGTGVTLNRQTYIGTTLKPGNPIGLTAGFNNATVTQPNRNATNGVIHVINRVLQPEP
jgi:uncharacterized surface protein with fasciclin (FAS1) repeats